MMKLNEHVLNQALEKTISKKKIFSAVLRVENEDKSFIWEKAAGEMQNDSRYFIASVTKLYVTAVIMRLVEERKLNLNDKISEYLPGAIVNGIHILKGVDYSGKITINHLLSNTSGLPDYFFYKQEDGKSAASQLLQGIDEPWPFEKTINIVKKLKPRFYPGKRGKASYSDTNYQLLERIIENIAGQPIGEVFREYIFEPLNLVNTYVYSDTADTSPVGFYYKTRKLWLPNYMVTVAAEGGIVSTAEENMIFLKEFFKGRFFPKEKIRDLKKWNLILPPPGMFYYGIGLEKLFTPRILYPFKPIKEILGFWGQTGSFAFYNPDTDLYFTGTTNQIDGSGHMAAGNAILKIIRAAL